MVRLAKGPDNVSFAHAEEARLPLTHLACQTFSNSQSSLQVQMGRPLGLKQAHATRVVARHPSSFSCVATPSVAARLPTQFFAIAFGVAARLSTMSWLTHSDQEMTKQIKRSLYEPWPHPTTRGRMIEVYFGRLSDHGV